MRVVSTEWGVGDVVTDESGTRWSIRAISPAGAVLLVSTNHPNHESEWKTTLDRLPEKTT